MLSSPLNDKLARLPQHACVCFSHPAIQQGCAYNDGHMLGTLPPCVSKEYLLSVLTDFQAQYLKQLDTLSYSTIRSSKCVSAQSNLFNQLFPHNKRPTFCAVLHLCSLSTVSLESWSYTVLPPHTLTSQLWQKTPVK